MLYDDDPQPPKKLGRPKGPGKTLATERRRNRKRQRGRPRIHPKPKKPFPRMGDKFRKKYKKLSYIEVQNIKAIIGRDKHKKKQYLFPRLSEEFGCSMSTIYRIYHGEKCWYLDVASEKQFQVKVLKFLKKLPYTWYFKADERARRGVPDVIACCGGTFVAMELKASKKKVLSKANKSTWLQMFNLEEINTAEGVAFIVYPENWNDVKDFLNQLARRDHDPIELQNYTRSKLCYWRKKAAKLLGFSPKTGVQRGEDGFVAGTTGEGWLGRVPKDPKQVCGEGLEGDSSGEERGVPDPSGSEG